MGKIKKGILLFILNAALIASAVNLNASTPEIASLREGDIIKGTGNNIYIVNELGYKRLFLNPVIFNFYGHLGGFAKVKSVSNTTAMSFITSALFRNCESGDGKVYTLETTGEDTGTLHWLNISGQEALSGDPDFFKKVFCINNNEFNWYPKGISYNSLNSAPSYSFMVESPRPSALSVDLKVNGTDIPDKVDWNSKISASWTSQGALRCQGFEYMNLSDANLNTSDLPSSGNADLYAKNTYFATNKVAIHIVCYNEKGEHAEDYISLPVNDSSLPSISVISPAQGQSVSRASDLDINWTSKNLSSSKINILLAKPIENSPYKGNYAVIAKNIDNSGSYRWKVGEGLTPDISRGTANFTLENGEYLIIITDSDQTTFGGSAKFLIK